jgi:hypothetical protein
LFINDKNGNIGNYEKCAKSLFKKVKLISPVWPVQIPAACQKWELTLMVYAVRTAEILEDVIACIVLKFALQLCSERLMILIARSFVS